MKDVAGTTGASSYLPAGRASPATLSDEIAAAAASPVVDALLQGQGAAVAVVDEHRQILALNASYLRLLGVADPAEVVGLRPGEAIRCAHALEGGDGCGSGRACASCGLAVALLVASHRGKPGERDCHLAAAEPDGTPRELTLRVRAAPLALEGHAFLLVSLVDVTAVRRREAVARAFLHDLANTVAGLCGAIDGWADAAPDAMEDARMLADELVQGIRIQRLIAYADESPGRLRRPARQEVALATLVGAVRRTVQHHPSARRRRIEVAVHAAPGATLETDPTLVRHVVVNMLVNALEATRPAGAVRLVVRDAPGSTSFRVWNADAIPVAVVPRVFQRYFTTKGEPGRGEGTWSMKLFGEEYLGGAVGFTSSPVEGTWFELRLPRPSAARA
jgi:signal transduction histidine kinase